MPCSMTPPARPPPGSCTPPCAATADGARSAPRTLRLPPRPKHPPLDDGAARRVAMSSPVRTNTHGYSAAIEGENELPIPYLPKDGRHPRHVNVPNIHCIYFVGAKSSGRPSQSARAAQGSAACCDGHKDPGRRCDSEKASGARESGPLSPQDSPCRGRAAAPRRPPPRPPVAAPPDPGPPRTARPDARARTRVRRADPTPGSAAPAPRPTLA